MDLAKVIGLPVGIVGGLYGVALCVGFAINAPLQDPGISRIVLADSSYETAVSLRELTEGSGLTYKEFTAMAPINNTLGPEAQDLPVRVGVIPELNAPLEQTVVGDEVVIRMDFMISGLVREQLRYELEIIPGEDLK